jgi:hypothetical protein
MKKLAPLLTPLLVVMFLTLATRSLMGDTVKTYYVSGTNIATPKPVVWQSDITQLSTLNTNKSLSKYFSLITNTPPANLTPIYIEVEIDTDGQIITPITENSVINTNGNVGLFLTRIEGSSGEVITNIPINMTFQYFGYIETSNFVAASGSTTAKSAASKPEACAGVIIGIVVLVVAGYIIYVLYKTCKKCLDKNNK